MPNARKNVFRFKKYRTGFISVYNENLSFVSIDQKDIWQCVQSIPLNNIIGIEPVDFLPKSLKNYDFPLLIVPDFWFGNSIYPFHSNNKSIIEAFIARKLRVEFPKSPAIQDLFSYRIVKNEKGEQEIVTYFLQEPKGIELCHRLAKSNLRPVRITSLALLWNHRLKTRIESFEKIGVGLIYLYERECSLFFYHRGNFIFSRSIFLPESQEDNTAQFEILSYETNQSVYHFSQRTKTEIDKIFFISRKKVNVGQFSEILGREVEVLEGGAHEKISSEELMTQVGLAADFRPEELMILQDLPGVSDRVIIKEQEWKRIQNIGMIIGLTVLLILGMEFGFLKNVQEIESSNLFTGETEPKQVIEQYNEALDVLLNDVERDKPMAIIGSLAASLPENIKVDLIDIEIEPSHFISLEGIIRAYGADDFSSSLRALVENINMNLESARPLTIDDVDIEMRGNNPEGGYQDYHISFRLDLT